MVDFGGGRESKNFVDATELTRALFGHKYNDGLYDRSKISLSPREYSWLQNGMSLQDIMYIRAIKAKIVPDDSGSSMIPDNTSSKPYR